MSKRSVAVVEKPQGDPASLGAMIPIDDEETVSLAGPDLGFATVSSEEIPARLHAVEEVQPRQPFVPPRRTNGNGVAKAPPVMSPKKEITRLLPSAHRIYVYKVKDDGKQTFCSEYSAQELQGSGTIEAFLRKFVVHEYEYGTFNLYLYDGSTENPRPIGSVTIEAPASHKAALNGNGHSRGSESLKELYELQKEMAEAVQKQAQAQAVPQKSPSEEYREMFKSMAEMKAMLGDGKSNNDSMSPMMMMWMMQQRQPPPPPQVDPTLSRMMEKVMERIENMEREQQMLAIQPPPMMPDQGRPQAEVLMQMMQENTRVLIAAMQNNNQDKRDPIMDLANLSKLIESKNDTLTVKDIFTMIPQIKEMVAPAGATSDPFQKTVENFRLFKLMQREFGEDRPANGQGQPPQDNFFTFAKGLLQSDVGKSIAAQIMQQGAGQEAARMHDQRRMNQQRQAQQVAQQRQQANAQRQQQRAQAALPPGQPRPEPQGPQAVNGIPTQPQAPQHAPVAAQPQPQPQRQPPPPPPQAEEEESEDLEVPDGFLEVHAPQINSAANPAERIGAIINGLQLLGTSKDFRQHLSKMFNFLKVNRKLEALEILHELLEFFADNDVLDKKIPDQARADFAEHWALIRQNLQFPDVPEVFPEGHESAAPAQAEQEQEQAAS